jgi:uncharacterized membrane protein SirB2
LLNLSKFDRLWLRFQGVEFIGWETIRLPAGNVRVAIIRGSLLAQCTPTGIILINEKLLGKRILDYVLLHEQAHHRSVVRLFFYTLPPLTATLLILSGLHTLLLLGILLTSLLASWLTELHAEVTCVRKLGLERFLELRRRLAEEFPTHIPLHFLYHPPDELTLFVCRRLTGANNGEVIENCKQMKTTKSREKGHKKNVKFYKHNAEKGC